MLKNVSTTEMKSEGYFNPKSGLDLAFVTLLIN